MPRFAANLSFMFNEVPFADRFEAAAKAGFRAVEFLNPFELPKAAYPMTVLNHLFDVTTGFGPHFQKGTFVAVENLSFDIARGEIVAVLGKTGCGKSTLGRMIAGILPKSEGEFLYEGVESAAWSAA